MWPDASALGFEASAMTIVQFLARNILEEIVDELKDAYGEDAQFLHILLVCALEVDLDLVRGNFQSDK
jgi:hypothetical protein